MSGEGRGGPESSFTECRLRQRLPVIAIPLRPADRDIPLDLQAILAQCYRNGGYDDIDYAGEPDPPLSTQDDGMGRRPAQGAGQTLVR